MKNEQQKNQQSQDQPVKHPPLTKQNDETKQQKNNQSQSTGNDKSNISVDNDGRIGKQHEWNKDDNKDNQKQQVRSDKTVTEPEIDAPIYDPEKTEKKIPRMEGNNDKK